MASQTSVPKLNIRELDSISSSLEIVKGLKNLIDTGNDPYQRFQQVNTLDTKDPDRDLWMSTQKQQDLFDKDVTLYSARIQDATGYDPIGGFSPPTIGYVNFNYDRSTDTLSNIQVDYKKELNSFVRGVIDQSDRKIEEYLESPAVKEQVGAISDPRLSYERIISAAQYADTYLQKQGTNVNEADINSFAVPVALSISRNDKERTLTVDMYDLDNGV